MVIANTDIFPILHLILLINYSILNSFGIFFYPTPSYYSTIYCNYTAHTSIRCSQSEDIAIFHLEKLPD
jgi:hypothetical protein